LREIISHDGAIGRDHLLKQQTVIHNCNRFSYADISSNFKCGAGKMACQFLACHLVIISVLPGQYCSA